MNTVQFKEVSENMNKVITSKEAILCVGRDIVMKSGLQGLNIRDIAKQCEVSVGSIYNYFPTKSDLIIATIESVWCEMMQNLTFSTDDDFLVSVHSLFCDIQKGSEKFPSFFSSHSMSILEEDKAKGREHMDKYILQLKKGFLSIIDADKDIRHDAFSKDFTKDQFLDFVINNFITLLIKKANTCDVLLEMIKRSIY